MMEDEINLREYVEVLLRHWVWIVGLALAAALVAFLVSSFLPPTYEASAVVLVTEPRYQIQFDSRFDTEQRTPAYKAFPTLAESDSILQAVIEAYTPPSAAGIERWNLSTLSGMVSATSGGDPSLLLLQVQSRSAEAASAIVNVWADTVIQQGNAIYGGSGNDVDFFQRQLEQAQAALDDAEAALIEFEARNQGSILQAQLNSLNQTQTDYLESQRAVAYIIQDIQSLRSQLAEQPGSQAASLGDNLTALLLQIKAFNTQVSTSGAAPDTPIQLQIDSSEALSTKSRPEQIAFLEDLVATLQAKAGEIEQRLAELEPRILATQEQLQSVRVESDRMNRTRDLSRETYLTLARKLEEARIAAQEESGVLQVGSYAAVPVHPIGPRRLMNTAVAGILGLVIGVVAAFGIEFWRRDRPEAEEQATIRAAEA